MTTPIMEPEDIIRDLKAENARLREALRDLLAVCYRVRCGRTMALQEAEAKARNALGTEVK